jgi:hypothetical protein
VALLNPIGRAVLVNIVLDSQLIYAMSVMQLLQGTLDALDRRRRTFLWSGDEQVHGAQCLVALEKVCQEKEQGGMGIKDITAENKFLLLKLLHRLHNPGDSAWARWVRERVDLATMAGEVAGPHWRDLAELMPLYRAVTTCAVRDGTSTCFWEDRWLNCGRLKEVFPLLHSHAVSIEVSVARVLRDGVRAHLMPRLTAAARGSLPNSPRSLKTFCSRRMTTDDPRRSSGRRT